MKVRLWLIVFVAVLLLPVFPASAQTGEICVSRFIAGRFVTICFGGGEGPPASCTPGTSYYLRHVTMSDGWCEIIEVAVDNCSGQVLHEIQVGIGPCGAGAQSSNPCEIFEAGPGGITCGTEWLVSARVGFPQTLLDLRPYPASLVRWPSAARCAALPPASGSGSLAYYSASGGVPENPRRGDWRDLVLTLNLTPAGPMFLSLPHIGELALPPVGEGAAPIIFQWELPSHPEAGGSALAGQVSGLSELSDDMPLFVGQARSPYRLFWRLTYEEYMRKTRQECEAGPDEDGLFECKTAPGLGVNDGHWETVVYFEWEARQRGGEVHPAAVQGLPSNLAADLNQDGTPDAYWNHNLTLRRMDEAGRVDNPEWAASWNWGGAVYWAVREAQGQIGRP